MIDIDKVKAAFAATSKFCQKDWHKPSDGSEPAALCAASALLAFAGVHPDLIAVMRDRARATGTMATAFSSFMAPVIDAYYGVPYSVAFNIMTTFDSEVNEWKGVEAVITLFENHNASLTKPVDVRSLAASGPCTCDACQAMAVNAKMFLDTPSPLAAPSFDFIGVDWSADYLKELFNAPTLASPAGMYFASTKKQAKDWLAFAAGSGAMT